MLDSNDLPLGHATFACANDGRGRRHVVDVFAAIAWFRELAGAADASKIADVVRFYDSAAASADRIKWRHDQWTARAKGAWNPDPKTIAATELLCPGSSAVLSLALWPSLRSDWKIDRQLEEVSRRLPSGSFSSLEAQLRKPAHHLGYGMTKLRGRGTLDDLACLLIIMRRARDEGSSNASRLLATTIQHVLLVQAGWLLAHGLVRPLVEYVEKHFSEGLTDPYHYQPLSAERYFQTLRRLVSAIPRHYPAMLDAFDAEMWRDAASFVLTKDRAFAASRTARPR